MIRVGTRVITTKGSSSFAGRSGTVVSMYDFDEMASVKFDEEVKSFGRGPFMCRIGGLKELPTRLKNTGVDDD